MGDCINCNPEQYIIDTTRVIVKLKVKTISDLCMYLKQSYTNYRLQRIELKYVEIDWWTYELEYQNHAP